MKSTEHDESIRIAERELANPPKSASPPPAKEWKPMEGVLSVGATGAHARF